MTYSLKTQHAVLVIFFEFHSLKGYKHCSVSNTAITATHYCDNNKVIGACLIASCHLLIRTGHILCTYSKLGCQLTKRSRNESPNVSEQCVRAGGAC